MNLLEFLQNGPERRRKLDEAVGNFMTRITPPNLRPAAEFVAEANPVQAQMGAMQAGSVVFDPEQTAEARKRAALDMGVEMAFALTPTVLARMGYLTPVQGVVESLVGGSPAQEQIKEDAGRIVADATGLGRGLLSGDKDIIGEVFQRGGEPQSVGAAKTEPYGGILQDYSDVDVIDPRDLIGAKISPTPADLTAAGKTYTGIDAAGTNRDTPLLGGPLFPLQQKYSDADIAWLVNSASKGSTKLGKDSDFLAVTAMSPKAHQSNATLADVYMGTLEAYIKKGRMKDESVDALNNLIRNFGKSTVNPELAKLSNFVGFDSPQFDDFMQEATFPQREAISKLMTSKEAVKFGGPNMQKILDATIQPEFAGANLGDTMLLLELDKNRGLINLEKENLPVHMSYDTGLGGRVVGKFQNPVARSLLFDKFEREYSARPTMLNKSGRIDDARMSYSFGRALPVETMTKDKARNILEAVQYHNIAQPLQAELIESALANSWKTSRKPFDGGKGGGISPSAYESALQRNPSLPSLEPYTAKQISQGSKKGTHEFFQLGDADVYFGLVKNPDYTWMNDGKPIKELGDNEVDLVGVISNEIGAKGVASPAVLGKAIEEGASVLNAFAVPSDKFPEGFLPSVYGRYGFNEVKRIPFSKEYYIEERGQEAFDDLIKQWRSEGWDESQGYPDVVLMKWKGTDADRENASKKVFQASFEGFGSGEARGVVAEARGASGQSVRASDGQQISGQDNRSGNPRSVRSDSGSHKSTGIRGAATELGLLSPLQRKNLGLLN